ncbi:hypothetical protein D1B33_08330 [Lysinibacillus yapensis]|uniref:Uncharacterized protein n=1 Tax=Ureibacillus yapensis TaxID=2304605 RepID=A0A396SCT6_9BACL|nr:hypothetical protein D1B33_08330 [Lysinibacillus yapensis]
MSISEYCGNTEFTILQFIYYLTNEIQEKIIKKKLFYKEQVLRYVTQQIDSFFKNFKLKKALLQSYKHEVFNTIVFKLQHTIKKHIIFQCS